VIIQFNFTAVELFSPSIFAAHICKSVELRDIVADSHLICFNGMTFRRIFPSYLKQEREGEHKLIYGGIQAKLHEIV